MSTTPNTGNSVHLDVNIELSCIVDILNIICLICFQFVIVPLLLHLWLTVLWIKQVPGTAVMSPTRVSRDMSFQMEKSTSKSRVWKQETGNKNHKTVRVRATSANQLQHICWANRSNNLNVFKWLGHNRFILLFTLQHVYIIMSTHWYDTWDNYSQHVSLFPFQEKFV